MDQRTEIQDGQEFCPWSHNEGMGSLLIPGTSVFPLHKLSFWWQYISNICECNKGSDNVGLGSHQGWIEQNSLKLVEKKNLICTRGTTQSTNAKVQLGFKEICWSSAITASIYLWGQSCSSLLTVSFSHQLFILQMTEDNQQPLSLCPQALMT